MTLTRKTLWLFALLLTFGAIFAVLFSREQGVQFSADQQRGEQAVHVVSTRAVTRTPELSGPLVAVFGGETAQNGITLGKVISLSREVAGTIFAIRSLTGIYPDGTSERYEVLYAASNTPFRVEVSSGGISSPTKIAGVAPHATPIPSSIPNSREALIQLTANPYFKNAHTTGLALYFDALGKRWNYVVRTDLGDVSILIPKGK